MENKSYKRINRPALSWKGFVLVVTDEWNVQKMWNTVCSVSNLQLWALVKSFLYRRLWSSPLYSLWRSSVINRQESCTTTDNANAHVSSNQSLSWDIYSFLEKASPEGDTSKTERAEWRRVMMCLLEIAWSVPAFEVMQNALSVFFNSTPVQPGRLTDNVLLI